MRSARQFLGTSAGSCSTERVSALTLGGLHSSSGYNIHITSTAADYCRRGREHQMLWPHPQQHCLAPLHVQLLQLLASAGASALILCSPV